jgi:hypothetical protein
VVRQGKIVRHKAPLKLKEIWALRVRLQMDDLVRELALLNLGIDSKLRRCDLVALKVRDVCHGDQVANAPSSCSTRLSARCSLRSRRQPGTLSKRGSGVRGLHRRTSCFRAGCTIHRISGQTRQYARILGH